MSGLAVQGRTDILINAMRIAAGRQGTRLLFVLAYASALDLARARAAGESLRQAERRRSDRGLGPRWTTAHARRMRAV
eukprot:2451748-Pleurochrysis_carterae.AAC.2